MCQNQEIKFTETRNSYELSFLNGNISLPKAYGGYVIASSCGSGKTTVIKQIILSKFYEGIVYSASTIKECDDMYYYLVDMCTRNNIEVNLGSTTVKLTPDKILNVHSEPKMELNPVTGNLDCVNGVETSLWNNHPEKVADYYVVICTHCKITRENPVTLFSSNFNQSNSYSLIRSALTGVSTSSQYVLPRQWILIDELISADPFKVTASKNTMLFLGKAVWDETAEYNYRSVKRFPSFNDFTNTFRHAIDNDRLAKSTLGDLSVKSVKLKCDLMASVAYEDYNRLAKTNNDQVDIIYNLSNLVLDGMRTKVLLFDGTGDLTFINSDRFKVLTYTEKYNSPISVYKFDNHINRIVKSGKGIINTDEIEDGLSKNLEELQKIIDMNEKTLIVTWKNLKEECGSSVKIVKKPKSELKNTGSLVTYSINNDFDLSKWYKDRLLPKEGHEFDVIYYQSGKDKAINDYRDYDTIVFLGKFQVPNSAIIEFNESYGCATDPLHYTIYQLVQAICRTRIRKHNGEPINVYFSSDWNEKIVNDTVRYLWNKKVNDTIEIKDTSLNRIKDKWKEQVKILCDNYPEFKRAISKNYGIDFTISLDEIYDLIPMNEKRVKSYRYLIGYLATLGITMNITSRKS